MIYTIEQYELHSMKYEVEAKSEAEAIFKLLNGEGKPLDDSLDYIEVAEDYGMSSDENIDITKDLAKLGMVVKDIIPSIRSIE
jgi:hypothetical protein